MLYILIHYPIQVSIAVNKSISHGKQARKQNKHVIVFKLFDWPAS